MCRARSPSCPRFPGPRRGRAGPWVALPPDTTDDPVDATARGRLHWVPVHHDGHRARMGIIAEWITQTRPAVFVSDVSVEAAILARLMGIPVVVAAMRGDRRDEAHRLGYDLADALLAPWPSSLPEKGLARALARQVRSHGQHFALRRPAPPGDTGRPGPARRRQRGRGDAGCRRRRRHPEQVRDAADATPGWSWTVLGGAETPGSRTRGRSCAARASSSPMRDRTPSRNAPPRARPPS